MSSESTRARSLLDRASTTLRTDTLTVARDRFQEAAEAFDAAGDRAGVVECQIEEARALAASLRREDLTDADSLCARAAIALDKLDDQKALTARLHHVQGYVHLRAGRFAVAVVALRKAQDAFRAQRDRTGEARVLDTLGVLYERSNERERAALCLAHSHALKNRQADREGVAISLGNLGRLALHGGNPREAEGFFRLDLEVAQELHDTRAECLVRTNLAESLIAQGRAVEAARAANQALALSKRIGNDVGEGYARIVLSDVAHQGENEYTARTEAEEALACFERADLRAGKASARLALARVESGEGNHRLAATLALIGAASARRGDHADIAIDALLEARTQLQHEGLSEKADRALARARRVAEASHQPHLVERVRLV